MTFGLLTSMTFGLQTSVTFGLLTSMTLGPGADTTLEVLVNFTSSSTRHGVGVAIRDHMPQPTMHSRNGSHEEIYQ